LGVELVGRLKHVAVAVIGVDVALVGEAVAVHVERAGIVLDREVVEVVDGRVAAWPARTSAASGSPLPAVARQSILTPLGALGH